MTTEGTVKKFGFSDKLGYMFGDFGNDFTFILSTMFLLKFYTDVMGISGALVGLMMMAARFADAFTDIAMGQIVDRSRPGEKGKFLPWIRRMCGPVAVASFLMYAVWFRNMPVAFKVFWMFFTYLLWGSVFYTGINIPYGSMASAISSEPKDRAQLSNWRTIGASLASTVIGVVMPLVVYYTNVDGNIALSGEKMALAAAGCSIAAVICYMICYFLITERVNIGQKTERFNLGMLIADLAGNKPLIGIIVSSICMLLAQLTLTGMAAYIYPNYFRNARAQSASGLVGVVITLICAGFTVKLSERFGRKELGIASSLFSAVILIIIYFLHTGNAWVYVGLYAAVYIGMGIFALITWAMITDVIDDTEVKTGERSDGTIYAVYSFARKLGQAASSGLTGVLLTAAGYSRATAFDTKVADAIYNIAALVPAAGFVLLALSLKFLYPLGRERVVKNARILAEKHGR